ncbi:MAG: thiol reductase thioredoxin [Candidatus Zixiibacteriota bacterium]|nr:MAG: thiol reductase thioredoxin [candidate division Zixibacteria bacterium]
MGFFNSIFNRPPKPGKPRPITDESFEQEVIESDIPAVVDFWSSTCPPCQVMGGLLNEIGPDYAGRVNIFKLNVVQNPQTAMHYQVRSIPTLILFSNGRAVDKIVGLLPLNPLREKFDKLAQ